MCHCSSSRSSYFVRSTRSSLSALFEITGHHHDHDRPHRLTSVLVIGLCGIHSVARQDSLSTQKVDTLIHLLGFLFLSFTMPLRPISANLCYRRLSCRMQSGKGSFVRLATAPPARPPASQQGGAALGSSSPSGRGSRDRRACCQRVRLCACAPANLNSVKIASA